MGDYCQCVDILIPFEQIISIFITMFNKCAKEFSLFRYIFIVSIFYCKKLSVKLNSKIIWNVHIMIAAFFIGISTKCDRCIINFSSNNIKIYSLCHFYFYAIPFTCPSFNNIFVRGEKNGMAFTRISFIIGNPCIFSNVTIIQVSYYPFTFFAFRVFIHFIFFNSVVFSINMYIWQYLSKTYFLYCRAFRF